MKKLALIASAATLMALTTPAQAAELVFSTTGQAKLNDKDEPAGYVRTFSGGGVTVQASAWTISNGNSVGDAWLGIYGDPNSPGFLGVTTDAEGAGNNNTHTIDNNGQVDFVLLQFDKAVNLYGLTLDAYGDTDVSIRYGTTTYGVLPTWDGVAWSTVTSALPGTFDKTVDNVDGYRSLGTPSNLYKNTWIVSALFPANQSTDSFKLQGLKFNVQTPPAVPEPATWAMMIMGFGLVGGVMRRKKTGMNESLRFA